MVHLISTYRIIFSMNFYILTNIYMHVKSSLTKSEPNIIKLAFKTNKANNNARRPTRSIENYPQYKNNRRNVSL